MSTLHTHTFDQWIRQDFKQMNTELEELYFAQQAKEQVTGIGDAIKSQLVKEGKGFITTLLKEGNTDEGFDNGFDLLGNVGFFMAACRRHEFESTDEASAALRDASALAMHLGASLGVIPRFASSHLETHNYAINGEYRSFTALSDEKLFIDYNTRGVFAFIRASESLLRVLPLGVTHPVTYDLLVSAKAALDDAIQFNDELFDRLDIQRFFYCVRPYYKPHKVGLHEYRGANAGDFAGFNVIDLLLGLCRADDPYYSQLLVDKFLFMRPEDQLTLRDCMRRTSLLDSFLDDAKTSKNTETYQKNLNMFLAVCDAYGKTALQHHEKLVKKFIEVPADQSQLTDTKGLTASGPPLPVLLKGLRKLCDMRAAANREDIPTRYHDIQQLKDSLL